MLLRSTKVLNKEKMATPTLEQINSLFDKNTSELKEHVNEKISPLQESIATLSSKVDTNYTAVNSEIVIINNTIETNKTYLENTITELTATVNTNKITVTQLQQEISSLKEKQNKSHGTGVSNDNLPEFKGTKSENPNEFLHTLEQHFIDNSIDESKKLKLVQQCFAGTAKAWYDLLQRDTAFQSYDQVKNSILSHYWNTTAIELYKNTIFADSYDPNVHDSLVDYFTHKFHACTIMYPKNTPRENIMELLKLLNYGNITTTLIAANPDSFCKALEVLQKIENTIVSTKKTNKNTHSQQQEFVPATQQNNAPELSHSHNYNSQHRGNNDQNKDTGTKHKQYNGNGKNKYWNKGNKYNGSNNNKSGYKGNNSREQAVNVLQNGGQNTPQQHQVPSFQPYPPQPFPGHVMVPHPPNVVYQQQFQPPQFAQVMQPGPVYKPELFQQNGWVGLNATPPSQQQNTQQKTMQPHAFLPQQAQPFLKQDGTRPPNNQSLQENL